MALGVGKINQPIKDLEVGGTSVHRVTVSNLESELDVIYGDVRLGLGRHGW